MNTILAHRDLNAEFAAIIADFEPDPLVVVLPSPTRVRNDFVDRCGVVRAQSYARQRARNARFEHLRQLLAPDAVAPATDWAPAQSQPKPAWGRPSLLRCTCCRQHDSFLIREGADGFDDCVLFLERNQRGILYGVRGDCKPCLHDFYEESEPHWKRTCQAELHCQTLPEPHSFTVRVEAAEDDVKSLVLNPDRHPAEDVDELLTSDGEDFFHRRAFETIALRESREEALAAHAANLVNGKVDWRGCDRPQAVVTANAQTGWVSFTSGQAKARITANLSPSKSPDGDLGYKLRISYGRDTVDQKWYASRTDVLEAQERIRAWMVAWLNSRAKEPNVAYGITQAYRPAEAVAKARLWAERCGVACSIRVIRGGSTAQKRRSQLLRLDPPKLLPEQAAFERKMADRERVLAGA